MRFQLNARDVIQETVDGEALIIHTPSGTYYSLQGTGEYVWNALLAGHTPAEIARSYTGGTEGEDADLTAAVESFAEELHAEQLLITCDGISSPDPLPTYPEPFMAPVLQKYTDMQELLLVDPIHEVDPEAGWPQRQEPDSSTTR